MQLLKTNNKWTALFHGHHQTLTDKYELQLAQTVADDIGVFVPLRLVAKPQKVMAYFMLDDVGRGQFNVKEKDFWKKGQEGGDWIDRDAAVKAENREKRYFLREQYDVLIKNGDTARAKVVFSKLMEYGYNPDDICQPVQDEACAANIAWEE